MHLDRIELTSIEPCLADAGKVRAQATLSRDISDLLPYLNAVIPRSGHDTERRCLSFRHGERLFELHSTRVFVAKGENTTSAFVALDWLKDLINRTYERRLGIVPVHGQKHFPSVTDIWRLLPGGNCRRCGEQTCLAFATGLWTGNRAVHECPPLVDSGDDGSVLDLVLTMQDL